MCTGREKTRVEVAPTHQRQHGRSLDAVGSVHIHPVTLPPIDAWGGGALGLGELAWLVICLGEADRRPRQLSHHARQGIALQGGLDHDAGILLKPGVEE